MCISYTAFLFLPRAGRFAGPFSLRRKSRSPAERRLSKEGDPINHRDTWPLPEQKTPEGQQPPPPAEQAHPPCLAWPDWWFWGRVESGAWPDAEQVRVNLAAWDICLCLGPFFGLEREQPLPDRLHQLCAGLERLFAQPEEGPRLASLLNEQAQLRPLGLSLAQLLPPEPSEDSLAKLPPLLLAISGFCYGLGLGVEQDQILARTIFAAGQRHSPHPAQQEWYQKQLDRLCPPFSTAKAGQPHSSVL